MSSSSSHYRRDSRDYDRQRSINTRYSSSYTKRKYEDHDEEEYPRENDNRSRERDDSTGSRSRKRERQDKSHREYKHTNSSTVNSQKKNYRRNEKDQHGYHDRRYQSESHPRDAPRHQDNDRRYPNEEKNDRRYPNDNDEQNYRESTKQLESPSKYSDSSAVKRKSYHSSGEPYEDRRFELRPPSNTLIIHGLSYRANDQMVRP